MADPAKLVADLKTAVYATPPDIANANKLLTQLKIAMTKFTALPGGGGSAETPSGKQELLIARQTFELATNLSIHEQDIPGFERHFAQVKTFYFDYNKVLPESPFQLPVLGLNLMRLLAQNRIADFHTELELIPVELHDQIYIKFPIQLEQHLMEGSYNKILNARADVPAESYNFFIDILTNTVRDAIADCSESAYQSLPLVAAQRLFLFQTPAQLQDYIVERGWEVDSAKQTVQFKAEEKTNLDVPSMRVIREMLSYAKELERIV